MTWADTGEIVVSSLGVASFSYAVIGSKKWRERLIPWIVLIWAALITFVLLTDSPY